MTYTTETDCSRAGMPLRIAVTGLRGIPASWGGVERQCEEVYARLVQKGFHVDIYARSHYVPASVRRHRGMHVKRLPTIPGKGIEAFLHTFLSVLHILKSRADVVHFYTQGPCLFSWMPRIFRPGMTVFFTCQGLDWRRKKWSKLQSMVIFAGELCSVLFPHARIVVSEALQRYYADRYGVETRVIPNGVTMPMKSGVARIREMGLDPRDYFLCVGRLVPEKRFEDIIHAYMRRPRRCKLVVVGGSSDTDAYVRSLRHAASGNPAVIFTGYRYGRVLAELFSNARAFITASELEGLPLTLLEAMSCGCPVIVSDIPPHREAVGDLPARRFPVGDIERLSAAMAELETMDTAGLDAMGAAAEARVRKHFNWEDISESIAGLYLSHAAANREKRRNSRRLFGRSG